MTQRLSSLPFTTRALDAVHRWQAYMDTRLGQRLLPLYAALTGAGLGALVADRLVRSMWEHALFTGPNQWWTVALILTLLWIAIGAVAALAVLGPGDHAVGGGQWLVEEEAGNAESEAGPV